MPAKPTYTELERKIQELEQLDSAHKKTAATSQESQSRFQQLYQRVPVPYQSLDKNGKFIEVNSSWLDVLGYSREEVIGKNFNDFLPHHWKGLFDENFSRLKATGEITGVEFEIIKKDGSLILVSFHGKTGTDKKGNFLQTHCIFHDITRRKQTEQALKLSEEKYRTILESIEDGYYEVDLKGNFTFFNNSMCRILGYSTDELTALNNRQYMDETNARKVFQAFNQVYKTGEPHKAFDWELIRKDGTTCFVETSVTLQKNSAGHAIGFQGIARDITLRKQTEEALQASQKQFLMVLDGIDATIYVVDIKTYEILFMNRYMKESFGKDLTGDICWDVFRNDKGPCPFCPNEKLLDETGRPAGVYVWHDKNPITGKWYINYDRAIEWTDGRLVKLQIATDITHLKKMEAALRQARKMESIGTLTSGIAHDFNNIMSIILGNTELALEDTLESNPAFSCLKEIKTAGLRAANIVKQLLNFSRITSQKLQSIQIARVIKDAVSFLRSTIPAFIDIELDIQTTDETILGDPNQIHQIMMNLCINASQAMEQTGGRIGIRVEKLTLDNHTAKTYPDLKSGDHIRIIVSDTGPGIDPSIIDRIFDPYFTTRGTGKGYGMGLAVVHGIIENHNGAIIVDSIPGSGTRFSLFFPLSQAKDVVETQTIQTVQKENKP